MYVSCEISLWLLLFSTRPLKYDCAPIDPTFYVGEGKKRPGLLRYALKILKKDIHWIRKDLKLKKGESSDFEVRIRYRQPLQKATIFQTKDDLYISFYKPQSSIASGQFAAWYVKEELIGSGVIN